MSYYVKLASVTCELQLGKNSTHGFFNSFTAVTFSASSSASKKLILTGAHIDENNANTGQLSQMFKQLAVNEVSQTS